MNEVTDDSTTIRDAVRLALRDAMLADDDVILMGEDIGEFEGVFKTSRGLLSQFGEARVRDTPISEAGFVGMALGASVAGLRPVVEVMFGDFALVSADQLFNQIAKMRWMMGRDIPVPITVRIQQGIAGGSGPQHTQSVESLFGHFSDWEIVTASSAESAYQLLLAAIESDNPTAFFEARSMYGRKGNHRGTSETHQIGRASVIAEGSDVTLLSYLTMVDVCLDARAELVSQDIECEVIDLQSLRPLDWQTIGESVARTGRCLVVHEAPRFMGFGAEIAASLHERYSQQLRSPVMRIGGLGTPVPYAESLEESWRPRVQDVCDAVFRLARS